MAQDEARAERIRALKAERPDLTWGRIADAVGVRERSALLWQQTGGIGYETAKKLADVFDVDPDWLYSGRQPGETPDLMGALSQGDPLEELREQLDRIERKLDHQIRISEDYIDEARRTEARRAVIAETVSELDSAESAEGLIDAFRRLAEAEPDRHAPRQSSRAQRQRKQAPA